MKETERPDPERILEAVRKARRKESLGRLRIFFGMAAGVGKTTAMLQAAHEKKAEGVDVVIGVIHTHGRADVARLVEGLEKVPEREVVYRGVTFKELNLNAILYRKPQLVLVDELAHSNVEGSRHRYRWQDVLDLLQEGIDVYTTLNVQHVESRKEIVEQITGVVIRETVPDSIVEMASQIKLVDITPVELLQRLKEGKVYLGEKSQTAAANFFKEDSLTALREIALRMTAEKVDADLHEMLAMRGKGEAWQTTDRLMVAISHSPHSQRLIRATRRLAFSLKAPWIAVHVDNGKVLDPADAERLSHHLTLARELGAEVITVADPEIAVAIKHLVNEKDITQIVVGRSPPQSILRRLFSQAYLDQFVHELVECDVHILRQESAEAPVKQGFSLTLESSWPSYLLALGVICLVSFLCALLTPFLKYETSGLILLFTLILSGLFVGRGPLLIAAATGALIWRAYFVPSAAVPLTNLADFLLFLLFFLAAMVGGILTHRVRKREVLLRKRDKQSRALYEMMREIAGAANQSDLIRALSTRLGKVFEGSVSLLLKNERGGLTSETEDADIGDDKERAVAIWTLRNGKPAGWSTDTLSSVGVLCLPLKGANEVMGVLLYRPKRSSALSLEEMNFLQMLVQQLAFYFERFHYLERERRGAYQKSVDSLQQMILDSVSKEFQGPLFLIKEAASHLEEAQPPAGRVKTLAQLQENVEALDRGLSNLMELSKLSAGFLEIKKEDVSVEQLIQSSLETMAKSLEGREVQIKIVPDLPYLHVDPNLMDLALTNLLLNAVTYSPEGKPLRLTADRQGKEIIIALADEGPGIPVEALNKVFDKFFRLPRAGSGGLGLGLSVAKAIVEIHGGRITASNRLEGGAVFSIALPIE